MFDFAAKAVKWLNRASVFMASLFLAAMVVLTCANITLRLFGRPVRGTYELMALFGAAVTALALGITQSRNENIAVDILINTFPAAVRKLLRFVNNLICCVFFSMAAWKIADWAGTVKTSGEVTETLRIQFYPFTYLVAAGCGLLALVFLTELFMTFKSDKGDA